jgi:general secretion pathway protein C
MELILQRWSWVATLAAAILSAFFIARTVNTLAGSAIAPKPGISDSASNRPQLNVAPHTDLDNDRFAAAFGLPVPKPLSPNGGVAVAEAPPPVAGWSEDPVRSPLHGLLVGTAIASPDRWSLCQITNTDANETLVYAIGDTFLDARIYKIEKARVYVNNQGKNEFIDANPPGGPNLGVVPQPIAQAGGDGVKQLSENNYSISKKEIDNALANLSDLATKARIVPSFKNGAPNGFKLFSIVPDSLYSKIGVQNGDVIHKINGYEMNSPDKALEIYQKLRDATRIDIELERRGETVRKQYSIE